MRSCSKTPPKMYRQDYQPIIIEKASIMPALFYRFPNEKTATCVLAAQNSMTFFNRRRETFVAIINILWTNAAQDCLKEKATKI